MISTTTFRPLSFMENNPGLERANATSDLLSKLFQNYQQFQSARYAPDMAKASLQDKLAQIANTQAQTGLTGQQSQWFGPKAQAEIGLQGAQAANFGAQANEINSLLPSKLQIENFKGRNPLVGIGLGGDAGLAALIASAKAHPDDPAFKGLVEKISSNNPSDLTIKPSQYKQVADVVNNSGGRAQYNQVADQQQDLGYTPVNQNNVAQILGISPPQQQGGMPQQQNSVSSSLGIGSQQQTPGMNQQPGSMLDQLQDMLGVNRNQKIATTNWRNVSAAATAYKSLPENQKNAILAQLNGAGMDASEASNRLAKGETLDSIMQSLGYTKGNYPDMKFQPTTGTLTSMQTRNQATQELEPMTQFVIDSITPYSRNIFGWNPSQVADSLSTNDPESLYKNANAMVNMDSSKVKDVVNSLGDKKQKQADFLAAQMLIPEVASVRFRALAGKQMGVEAMNHLEKSSDMQRSYLKSAVTPEVWNMAQNKMNDVMRKAVSAGTSTSYFGGQSSGKASQPAATSSAQPDMKVRMQTPDGKIWSLPQDKADEAIKFGAKRIG